MEWRDEGLIIGARKHGEASTIVEALTRAHGRHLGLVRGGRSARLRATLQPGNTIGLTWRARLDEHLGSFAVEPLSLRAGRLMDSALALTGINYLAALVRVLPERDPHPALYEAASLIADGARRQRSRADAHRPVRGADPGRVRVPARPLPLRRDRRDRWPRLCLAQIRTGGERRGRGALAGSCCCRCRRSCAKAPLSKRSRAGERSPTVSG